MPKNRMGGKAQNYFTTTAQQTPTPPPPLQQSTPTPPAPQLDDEDIEDGVNPNTSTTYSDFQKMSLSEKVQAIDDAISQPVPSFLTDNAMQRVAYALEIDGKPQVVTDAQLDAMKGKDLYRTVRDVYDSTNDLHYSGKRIAQQIMDGDFTRYSGMGSSAYGTGLYFADDFNDSRMYGSGRSSDVMVRAKLNSNAKTIASSTAENNAMSEIRRGTALGKVLNKVYNNRDRISIGSIWAIVNGYNVMTTGVVGYYVVLDRSALTVSSTTKNPNGRRSW